MKRRTLQLLLPLLLLGASAFAQEVRTPAYGFLPAVGHARLGESDVYCAWDIGSSVGGVGVSPDGTLTVVHLSFSGAVLLGAQDPPLPVESEALASLRVRPNPASHRTVVSWDGSTSREAFSVAVYSSLGQLVREVAVRGAREVSLACDALPSGVYVVRLLTEAGQPLGHAKLVVRR